jgi:hypothetical protein
MMDVTFKDFDKHPMFDDNVMNNMSLFLDTSHVQALPIVAESSTEEIIDVLACVDRAVLFSSLKIE